MEPSTDPTENDCASIRTSVSDLLKTRFSSDVGFLPLSGFARSGRKAPLEDSSPEGTQVNSFEALAE